MSWSAWRRSIGRGMWLAREAQAVKRVKRASGLLGDEVPPQEIETAVRIALQAERSLRIDGDRTGQVAALRIAARGLQMRGQFAESAAVAERALEIAHDGGDPSDAMFTLGTLAFSRLSLGDSRRAIELAEEALRIARGLGAEAEAARAVELGQVYAAVGNYSEAIQLLGSNLPVLKQTANANIGLLVAGLQCHGTALLMSRRAPEAMKILEECASLAARHQRHRICGQALVSIAMAWLEQGDRVRADAAIRSAVDVLKTCQRTPSGLCSAILWLGVIEWTGGKFNEAQRALEEALAVAQQYGQPWAEVEALTALGGFHCCLESFDAAEGLLRRAVSLREDLRTHTPERDPVRIAIDERFGFEAEYLQIVLHAKEDARGALRTSERSRARAFSDLLADYSSDASAHAVSDREWYLEIAEFSKETNTTWVEYSLIQLLDPEAVLNDGASGFPVFRDLMIYVVRPDRSLTAVRVPGRDLDEQILGFSGAQAGSGMQLGTRNLVFAAPSGHGLNESRLRSLYNALIQPIAHLLPRDANHSVVIVPNVELFSVPFATLRDDAGRRLIEKHTILVAPSIEAHMRLNRRAAQARGVGTGDALVVGNPLFRGEGGNASANDLRQLEFAEREAVGIAELYGVAALTGARASKAQVMASLADSSIVHIATHGIVDPSLGEEMPGAILLSPADGDDGLLRSDELARLKLNCELVVLSACNTGLGRVTNDGVIGLSRALLQAGVATVVVALSEVRDDTTSYLMQRFHAAYVKAGGRDAPAALREAMLSTMQIHPSPSLWGSFIVMGMRRSDGPGAV